jgi:hypothetical protein
MIGKRIHLGLRALLAFTVLVLAAAGPLSAMAQDSPFGESEFVSPKYGTTVEWTEDWFVDNENSAIEVRRDVLGLIRDGGDEAVLIELQSQRSYRTGEEYINAALATYSRLEGFEVIDDQTDASPPSMIFQFSLTDSELDVAGYIQSQPIAGATMVVIVLALLEDLDATREIANSEITVNGVPLLEALPICGDDAEGEAEESDGSGDNKADSFGGSRTDEVADCVELFRSSGSDPRPTPTPEPDQRRGDTFNQRTWESEQFPGAGFGFDRTAWEIESELDAAENNGRDGIILFHNELPTYVVVEVFDGFNGRAGACIDVVLAEASISPGSDELILDVDGNPIQGSQQGRVWAAYSYELELESGPTEVGGYVECRSLPGAKGVLVMTMISNIETFSESYEVIAPIIASIRLG